MIATVLSPFFFRERISLARRSVSSILTRILKQIAPALMTMALLCAAHPALAQGFTQTQGPIFSGDTIGHAGQGASVAISGEGTVVWGGTSDNSSVGAVWVSSHGGPAVKLVGSNAGGQSQQGVSVAISADGNTVLLGGYRDSSDVGAAWVFVRVNGVWSQQGSKLVGASATGKANQGFSVALSADGNTAIVGGPNDSGTAGAAWVWARSGGVWSAQTTSLGAFKLVGSGATGSASQGLSVALSGDGNTAIVGGPADNSSVGAAWVWTRSGGVWTQQGTKLVGTGAVGTSSQGWSVALSGDGNTALVGGYADNNFAGAAWVFARSAGAWSQQGNKLVGATNSGPSKQGTSAALSADGNTALIGGPDDTASTGAAWAYTRSGNSWSAFGPKLVGSGANLSGLVREGYSVALSPDGVTAVLGGDLNDSSVGAIWLFTRRSAIDTATHDFNGDGKSDIAWRQTGGAAAVWLMNGAQVAQGAGLGTVSTNWQIVGQRDFNNDGKYDLLWRDNSSGAVGIWLMNGASATQAGTVGSVSTSWSVAGTSDFNYDGYADILWRDTSGNVGIWLMNGFAIQQAGGLGNVGLNWTIAAVDARRNIFWRDTSNGTLAIWQVYGLQVQQTANLGSVALNWTIAGVGDFDGNGSTDIVWRDTSTGNIGVWLMNGLAIKQFWSFGSVTSNWVIAEIGDYNGNGNSDILWRDTTSGQTAIWYINATNGTIASIASIATVGTDWTIQKAGAD